MRFFQGFLLTSASQFINLAGALASRVLMARMLGPAQYGGFGFSLNLVTVISRIFAFGLVPSVQYHASKKDWSRKDFLRTVVVIGVGVALALTAISIVAVPRLLVKQFADHPSSAQSYPYLALGVFPVVLGSVFAIVLIPWGRVGAYTVVQLMTGAFIAIAFGASSAIVAPLKAAIAANLIAWCIALAYNIGILRRDLWGGTFQGSAARKIWRYGLVVWPNVILGVGTARLATLLGGAFVPEEALGEFIVALNVAEGLFAFHAPLGTLLFSRVSEQERASFGVTQETMRVSVVTLLAVSAVFVLLGKPVLVLLFGRRFENAWVPALVLLGTGAAHALMRVLNNFLAGMGKPTRNTVTLASEVAALCALVPFLARKYGAIGLASASASAAAVSLVVSTAQGCWEMRCTPAALFLVRMDDLAKMRRRIGGLISGWRARGSSAERSPSQAQPMGPIGEASDSRTSGEDQ